MLSLVIIFGIASVGTSVCKEACTESCADSCKSCEPDDSFLSCNQSQLFKQYSCDETYKRWISTSDVLCHKFTAAGCKYEDSSLICDGCQSNHSFENKLETLPQNITEDY